MNYIWHIGYLPPRPGRYIVWLETGKIDVYHFYVSNRWEGNHTVLAWTIIEPPSEVFCGADNDR